MSHRPVDELSPSPAQATHSDVTAWSQGIFTRAALIDTPLWRRAPYVTASTPVTGDELADVVEADRLRPGAGEAIVVQCGRDEWEGDHGLWGPGEERPGLDDTCVAVLAHYRTSTLV